jgi:hypothetical protein
MSTHIERNNGLIPRRFRPSFRGAPDLIFEK